MADPPDDDVPAMGPADALRRIAYLLEAQRAETFKVRAFRRAADAVEAAGEARVRELAAAGRLGDLKGVGATSAAVAAEALDGRVPAYLVELEARSPGVVGPEEPGVSLDPEVRAMVARLRGDLHSHSDWSDGGSSIVEMARAAAALGHDYLALTDHSARLTVAHGLDAARLERQLDVVAAVNAEMAPFRLLTGMEVDILEDGSLDQEEELLGRLDVVVASVHSKLRMEAPAMTARMLRAIDNPHSDILGHCTGRLIVGRGRPPSVFDADAVFDACARTETAVEVNSCPERRDPPPELLARAVEAGCLLAVDTDAHAPGQLEWGHYGCEQVVATGVDPDRVVTTWPLDRLLAWTASHAG